MDATRGHVRQQSLQLLAIEASLLLNVTQQMLTASRDHRTQFLTNRSELADRMPPRATRSRDTAFLVTLAPLVVLGSRLWTQDPVLEKSSSSNKAP